MCRRNLDLDVGPEPIDHLILQNDDVPRIYTVPATVRLSTRYGIKPRMIIVYHRHLSQFASILGWRDLKQ